MVCLEPLLVPRVRQGEVQLKNALGGLLGGLLRSYLPQTWSIVTEHEALTIQADAQGNIRIMKEAMGKGDGEIRIPHDLLANGIRTGARPPAGSYQVTYFTPKGRTAFEYLRSPFGL